DDDHKSSSGNLTHDAPETQVRNVVLNTGVPCCPRLCLLATALDFPVLACWLLPWTGFCLCCLIRS
ncbi:hypothetical protein Hamer_G029737, partial [Homarus americanus]